MNCSSDMNFASAAAAAPPIVNGCGRLSWLAGAVGGPGGDAGGATAAPVPDAPCVGCMLGSGCAPGDGFWPRPG